MLTISDSVSRSRRLGRRTRGAPLVLAWLHFQTIWNDLVRREPDLLD